MSIWIELKKTHEPVSLERFQALEDGFATDHDALMQVCAALVADPSSQVVVDDIYRSVAADPGDHSSVLARATGAGLDDEVFFLSAEDVQTVWDLLQREPWFAELSSVADESNIPGLLRFYAAAARERTAIVGYLNV